MQVTRKALVISLAGFVLLAVVAGLVARPILATHFYQEGQELNLSKATQDKQQARALFERAAWLGNADAMAELAWLYHAGNGADTNLQEAFKWLQKAANAGNANAMHGLAYAFLAGRGVPSDEAKGLEWEKRAAAAGTPEAEYVMGDLYQTGKLVPKNPAQSVALWTKSAEGGYRPAMYKLAASYFYGDGVQKNPSKAFYWYREAADRDDSKVVPVRYVSDPGVQEKMRAEAAWNVAVAYHEGIGVVPDKQKSTEYMQRAAQAGNSNAKQVLEQEAQQAQRAAAAEGSARKQLANELTQTFDGARWATSGTQEEIIVTYFLNQQSLSQFYAIVGSNPQFTARLYERGFKLWCVAERSLGMGCNYVTPSGLQKANFDTLDTATKLAVSLAATNAGVN